MFQSTPPRGGRPIYDNVDLGDYVFQSTPPRGGRLVFLESPGTSKEVSIHAPTRGATRNETAEKSPDVGRRYRCKYLRISLKISNFTSNSNTL